MLSPTPIKENFHSTDHTPLVSVVLPTYNRSHLVIRAINSVLDQTYTDLELILVDDASNDEGGDGTVACCFGSDVSVFAETVCEECSANHGVGDEGGKCGCTESETEYDSGSVAENSF